MLLGLLAAKTAGLKGDYVPPVDQAKSQTETPQRAQQAAPEPEYPAPPFATTPAEEPFQNVSLSLQEVKEFIQPSEGTRSKVYRDSTGNKTVGVGFNLNAPGSAKLLRELGINYTAVKTGSRRLTPQEIDALFTRKVEDAMAAGPRVLKSFEVQPKPVQLAVTDMVYNLGPTGFSNLDTAVAALNQKDYHRAANALERTEWHRQVGSRARNIVSMIRNAGEQQVASNRMVEAVGGLFGSL